MANRATTSTTPKMPARSGVQAPTAIARSVRSISEKALGKVGQSFASLLSHWPQIVGGELASKCLPMALNFPRGKNTDAVLHLATHSAFALELSHQSIEILERINAFLGFRAVAELKFDHKMLALPEMKVVTAAFRGGVGQASMVKPSIVPGDTDVSAEVCGIYSDIKDPDVRARLQSLCRAVANSA